MKQGPVEGTDGDLLHMGSKNLKKKNITKVSQHHVHRYPTQYKDLKDYLISLKQYQTEPRKKDLMPQIETSYT